MLFVEKFGGSSLAGVERVRCAARLIADTVRAGHSVAAVLSAVLSVFAQCGANILTINQSIPVSGCATITISAETAGMSESMETLMNRLVAADGVIRAEILAG